MVQRPPCSRQVDRPGTTVCVPENSCLVFTINDSYGDGILL